MRYLKALFFFLIIFISFYSNATHIRAGEIVARRISSLTYQFTFIGYRDVEGVPFGPGLFDFGDGDFYGDDEDEQNPWITPIDLGNGVEKWQFTLTHTYAAGDNYLVSYQEIYRNANIQNIENSDNVTFYVETFLIIDPLRINNTPVFTVPPIDQGVVGVTFEHNPGAFDIDGDSLVYYFTTPKQGLGQEISSYRSLVDPSFYENFEVGNSTGTRRPSLSIDPFNGTLTWDAPGGVGIEPLECKEFNVAFVVEEWRREDGEIVKLGFVTRDMQIIVCNYENDPPEIEIPNDTCVVAGSLVQQLIIGTDPDGDPVKLEAFGGTLELTNSPATFSPNPPVFQDLPAVLDFEWQTVCGHVRATPYEVQFKATDMPTIEGVSNPTGQVNFETWELTVVGPPPTGLVADTQQGRKIQLNWDPYSCPNADSMQVWRRVGEFEIDPNCNPGIPENSGYRLIETLGINSNSFEDSNNNLGLAPGSKYCYRIVATFPSPRGGLSIASNEACDSLLIDVPVITNVDIKSTSETNGSIEVKWTPPYEIDASAFPPTYTYELLRKEGIGEEGNYASVFGPSVDTIFTDIELNTKDLMYSYKVVLYDITNIAVDTSQRASSIRLEPQPLIGAIRINWSADVPWSLNVQDYPYHYVWRDNVINGDLSSIQLIDSVDVTMDGLSYLDDGSFNGVNLDEEIEYCYFVTTQGSYGNDRLPEPLLNSSQIICAQPNDTIPPCIPLSIEFDASLTCEAQLEVVPCGVRQFENVFSWNEDGDIECGDDIAFYRVYFSRRNDGEGFELLDEVTTLGYRHSGINSLAGCYFITAVDRSGNESERSEIFCNDNCPRFILPNVITPNNDGVNDIFRPFDERENCPRFVESVKFKVFNRTGDEIFSHDSSEQEMTTDINWDGRTNGGKALQSGVYFYSAEVKFTRLNPEESIEVINGWVQIIR